MPNESNIILYVDAEHGVINRALHHDSSRPFMVEPRAVVGCTDDAVLCNAADFVCIGDREDDWYPVLMLL